MSTDTHKTKDQLISELQELRSISNQREEKLKETNKQLATNLQQLHASEQMLKKQTHDLGERVKELGCLYSVSKIGRISDISYAEIMQRIIEIIPPSWQYPQITCARITFLGKEFKSENFKLTKWSQSADIVVNNAQIGKIEVIYLKERPVLDEGPFLIQERKLLDSLKQALEIIIENKISEERIIASNQQLESYNQQLQATEQQLRAANQQLESYNQQFQATEQQLRASNQQLEANNQQLIAKEYDLKKERIFSEKIVETADAIIVGLDKDHIIRIFNRGAENHTGYKKEEVVGEDWFKIFFPEEMPNEMNKVWNDAWGVESHSYINPILSKSGKERIISWQNTGIYDSPDVSKHLLLSIGEDITERKQIEEALKDKNEHLRSIFDNMEDVYYKLDENGKVIAASPSALSLYGYEDVNEILGKNAIDFIYDLDEGKALITELQNNGFLKNYPIRHRRKNGNPFWVETNTTALHDSTGKSIGRIGVFRDITERKRNEQIQNIIHEVSNAVIISESTVEFISLVENELRTIIDTSNFFVALYDNTTDSISLLFHKDKEEKITTFPAGKTLTKYVVKTKKPLLAQTSIINKLEKSGEVELVGAQSKVWLGVPLFSKGTVMGVLAVQSYETEKAYDKTDLKTLEIISHQISISLERKKVEQDLRLALDKAKESDRLKTAFLNNMSHEIRTPLNGIQGFLGLLQEPELDDAYKSEYIEIINRSSARLINTVTDIIDISKIEAGQMTLTITEVSINKLLGELNDFFYYQAEKKGLRLNLLTTLVNGKSIILTDNHKLSGILTNLIKNAIKFTEKGFINFGYLLKNDNIEFFVKDTGNGVPIHRQKAIFNRFEQGDIENTRVHEGSGLGLAIAKSYTEMLGGRLWMKSKEGEGTKFLFTIPYKTKVKKQQTRLEQKNSTNNKTNLNDLIVLIAEDEEVNNQLFKVLFKNIFYRVIYVETGQQSIEACKSNPEIDMILMDIKMPGMSGYTAIREIRKFNKSVTIIAQTAFGFSDERQKAINAGCDDFISKPINKKLLFEKIYFHMSK